MRPLPFLVDSPVARFNNGTPQSMCVFWIDILRTERAFKRLLPEKIHLRVEDFADDISNNIIEALQRSI